MISINPQQFPILIRREFWEHRWAFQYAPLIIAGLMLLLMLMSMLFAAEIDGNRLFTDSAMRELASFDADTKAKMGRIFMFGLNIQFNGVMLIVLFFYLVGSLYDERKNRSILFWKSLPVSDGNTVLSKILTAGIAVPVAYMLVAGIVQIIALLVFSGYALSAGIPLWDNIWGPANILSVWFHVLLIIPVQMLWLLPLFGWFMFCSAFAPRLPWLIALAVPGLIGLFQSYLSLTDNLRLSETNVWLLFWERAFKGILPMDIHFEEAFDEGLQGVYTVGEMLSRFTQLDMWVGIVIGVAFLYGAVYLRSRATDK